MCVLWLLCYTRPIWISDVNESVFKIDDKREIIQFYEEIVANNNNIIETVYTAVQYSIRAGQSIAAGREAIKLINECGDRATPVSLRG